MTAAERWQHVKSLAAHALEQAPAERVRWLAAQDVPPEIRDEVAALLDAEGRAAGFLQQPALDQPGAAAIVRESTRPTVAHDVRPGETVGAYRIVRAIGEGGMGTVYLAARADEAFEKHVAIKLVRSADLQLATRLREERRLLASLEHPGIARLLDGGTTAAGVPYVVMEYVDGVPVDDFCTTHRLALSARLDLLRRICDAVQHAHRNLVVHRDIKASNILVTANGEPKLLDFGIAKALGDGPLARTLTGYSALTPETASPEQLHGEAITVATDVWGLGVLLYLLVGGRLPFAHATSAAALTHAICEEDPPAFDAMARVPRDVDLIVRKALAKRPQDRYESAAALAADLGRFLENRPVEAAPDSIAYRTRRFVTRHRVGVAVAATTILALGAGVVATVWQARIAEQERARAERRFDEVRQLANTIIFDLHDAISPLPGSTPARKMLVERALGYLDGLFREVSDDIGLQRELAAAYHRLAAVQGRRGSANLGDQAGARASIDKELVLLLRATAAPAALPRDHVALAHAYNERANLEEDHAAKVRFVDTGIEALNRLAPADRAHREAELARATLLWTAATTQVRSKDYARARSFYEGALAGFERLLQAAAPGPQAANASRNLSVVCKNLGALLWETGDRDGGMALYRRALSLDEARLATQPDNTTWRLDLSYSLASLAYTELETGDVAGSVKHYEDALALRKLALAADPQNAQAKDAVARGEQTLARARAALK